MKRICLYILLSLISWHLSAQQEKGFLGVMAKHETGKVSLKWFPSTYALWQKGNKYGYDVYKRNLAKPESPLVKLNDEPLKVVSEEEMQQKLLEDENNAGILFYLEATSIRGMIRFHSKRRLKETTNRGLYMLWQPLPLMPMLPCLRWRGCIWKTQM